MKKNLGAGDGLMRITASIILFSFFFTDIFINETLGIIAIVVAIIFVLTTIFGFCPIYALFNINTCIPESNKDDE